MTWFVVAAVLGASAVVAGAFGAHGLEGRVEPSQLEAWRTGADYGLLHSVVIFALAVLERSTARSVRLPAALFCAGALLFSGSIYLLVLTELRFVGPLTPLGGLCLLAGWLSLIGLARS